VPPLSRSLATTTQCGRFVKVPTCTMPRTLLRYATSV
jgi:hypothetical protein